MKLRCNDITREINADQLASICVELTGGGYAAEQTANAIFFQRQLLEGNTIRDDNNREWQIIQHKAVDTKTLIETLGKQCGPDFNRGWYVIGPVMVNDTQYRIGHIATCRSKTEAEDYAHKHNIG